MQPSGLRFEKRNCGSRRPFTRSLIESPMFQPSSNQIHAREFEKDQFREVLPYRDVNVREDRADEELEKERAGGTGHSRRLS